MSVCKPRFATVGIRRYAGGAFLPFAPATATVIRRLREPIPGKSLLVTASAKEPTQFWVNLTGRTRNLADAGAITEDTPGNDFPLVSNVRALITSSGAGDRGFRYEHDWRGQVLTPPATNVRVEMLSWRAPLDVVLVQRVEPNTPLPADAVNVDASLDFVAASVTPARTVDAGALAGAGILPQGGSNARGRQRVTIVDQFDWSNVHVQSLWFPFAPNTTRFRVKTTRIAGAGGFDLEMLWYRSATLTSDGSGTIITGPAAGGVSDWIEADGAIGLQPAITGAGDVIVWVEQEVNI